MSGVVRSAANSFHLFYAGCNQSAAVLLVPLRLNVFLRFKKLSIFTLSEIVCHIVSCCHASVKAYFTKVDNTI